MRKNIIKKKTESSPIIRNIVGVLLSSVIGIIITVLLTVLFSYVFANAQTITDSVGAFFVGCILVGAFVCGIISSRITNFKGIVSGAVCSIIYLLILTIIMLFFVNGQLSAQTGLLYIGVLIVTMLGGICGANIKRRK